MEQSALILSRLAHIQNQLKELNSNKPPKYLTIKSAAVQFDLSEEAVRGIIRRREVPFYKLGTRVRLNSKEFEERMIKYPSIDEVSLL